MKWWWDAILQKKIWSISPALPRGYGLISMVWLTNQITGLAKIFHSSRQMMKKTAHIHFHSKKPHTMKNKFSNSLICIFQNPSKDRINIFQVWNFYWSTKWCINNINQLQLKQDKFVTPKLIFYTQCGDIWNVTCGCWDYLPIISSTPLTCCNQHLCTFNSFHDFKCQNLIQRKTWLIMTSKWSQ